MNPGDTGTITLRWEIDRDGDILIEVPTRYADRRVDTEMYDPNEVVAFTVDPRLPKHWPPTAGEVWLDGFGDQWNAEATGGGTVILRDPHGAFRTPLDLDEAAESDGWRRVYPAEEKP